MSLGKCLTQAHAASFVIGTVLKHLLAILSRTGHRKAGIVTGSKLAPTEIQNPRPWARWTITDVERHAKRVERKRWYSTLTGVSNSASSKGTKIAGTVAQRAANQPTKAMRSALLSYIALSKPSGRSGIEGRQRRIWFGQPSAHGLTNFG